MSSMLYLKKCCKVPFLKYCTSSTTIQGLISRNTQLLRFRFPVSTQVRTFWETFPHIRPLFYEKDGLSRSKYELIYHAKLFNYAFYGQLITSIGLTSQSCAAVYYAWNSYIKQEVVTATREIGPFIVTYDLPTVFVISLLAVQSCLIIIAAQNAVLRIYYCQDNEKFVFVTLGWNPFTTRLTSCSPGELNLLKESTFNIIFGNHRVHKKNLYLRNDSFKSMYYYKKLLGDLPMI